MIGLPSSLRLRPRRRHACAVAALAALGVFGRDSYAATATWLTPVSGNWTDGTKWSGGIAPGSGGVADAVIDATGSPYTVTRASIGTLTSVTLASSNATLAHTSGTVTLGQLNITAGTYALGAGKLVNTSLAVAPAASFSMNGGTLERASLASDLFLGTGSGTFATTFGLNGHAITVAGSSAASTSKLTFAGYHTLGGAGGTVTLGGAGTGTFTIEGGNLTIGASVTLAPGLDSAGGTITGTDFGSLNNDGTIYTNRGTGQLIFKPYSISNTGLIETTAGTVSLPRLTNSGTVRVTNAAVVLDSLRQNTGSIVLDNAATSVSGTTSTTAIKSLQRTGGTFNFGALRLDNAGEILDLDEFDDVYVSVNDWITGGSIRSTDPAALQVDGPIKNLTLLSSFENYDHDATFENVTLAEGVNFDIYNKLGYGRRVTVVGTLAGTGAIRFAKTRGTVLPTAGSVIDAGVTITTTDAADGSVGGFSSTAYTNKGTIQVTPGRKLFLGSKVTNLGTIRNDGGTLIIGGANTPASLGTVINNGGKLIYAGTGVLPEATIDLGATPLGVMSLGGATITGKTVTSSTGTLEVVATQADTFYTGNSTTTLNNVTLAAPRVDLRAGASITVGGGTLTLDGASVRFIESGASIKFGDIPTTLTGTGEIVFDAGGSLAVLNDAQTSIGSGITVRTGAGSGAIGADFTNYGHILADAGNSISFGSRFTNRNLVRATDGAKLTMSAGSGMAVGGVIDVNGVGTTLAITVPFDNLGTLNVTDGATLAVSGNATAVSTASVNFADATLLLTGTWVNTGATLPVVTGGRTLALGSAGKIDGGTIISGASDPLRVADSAIATLSNVVVDAPVSIGSRGTLTLTGVTNRGVLTADNSLVNFGTGSTNSAGTLRAINNGTISVAVANLPNLGAVSLSDSRLNLTSGTFSGDVLNGLNLTHSNSIVSLGNATTLQNAGQTKELDGAGLAWRLSGGRINGGVVHGSEAAPDIGVGIIDGVTLAGRATAVGGFLQVTNNLTLVDGAQLRITNPSTPLGAAVIFSHSAAATVGGEGEIVLIGNGILPTSIADGSNAPLTIGPGMTVRTEAGGPGGKFDAGGVTPLGGVTNRGVFSARHAGATITVTGRFANEGLVEARGGGRMIFTNTPLLANATISGGRWEIHDGSSVEFRPGNPLIYTNAATILLDGPSSSFTALDALKTNSGSLALAGGRNFTTVGALTNSGTLALAAGSTFVSAGALTWSGGAIDGAGTFLAPFALITADVTRAGGGTTRFDALTVAADKHLDLTTGKLVTREPIGSATGGVYGGMQGLVQAGHNAGAWNGGGLVTTSADAISGLTSLGVATAEQAGYAGGTFGGISVAASDVLVMYTYAGDANLDGFISGDDYAAIDFNIAVPGASGWYNGDFNYDGIISGDDYAAIDFNIVAQGAPFPTSGATPAQQVVAVPEPAGFAMLAAAAFASLPRRRRR